MFRSTTPRVYLVLQQQQHLNLLTYKMIGTLLVGAARLLRSQPCTLILAVAIMLIIVQAESKVDTGKRQTMKDEQVQVEQLATKDAPVIVLNEDNWRHMLKDEWMVEL